MSPLLVHVTEHVLRDIAICTQAAMPNETGGALIGWREGMSVSVMSFVEIASSRQGRTRYEVSTADLNTALAARLPLFPDPQMGYVGTWHSHPAIAGPSLRDKCTFWNTGLANPGPLAFLVAATDGQSTTFHTTWAGRRGGRYQLRRQEPITRKNRRS